MFELVASNPLFLWMLPLAGLPILFHLFFKVRKRTRVFPSLMFFQRADPRLSARKRIRELLALLLRILAILLLLLALARPVWLNAGRGGTVAQVLVIDNSASMSMAARNGRTRLDEAVRAAEALIADLRETDMATIALLAQDVSVPLVGGLTSEKEPLLAALKTVSETDAVGTPARALRQACDLLAESPASRREIHVLTDLQENEWAKPPFTTQSAPPNTTIVLHQIGGGEEAGLNTSLGPVEMPDRRWLAGRRGTVSISVENANTSVARVRLDGTTDADERTTREIEIPPQNARTVELPVRPATAGFHWLDMTLGDDAFRPDNRSFAGFFCAGRQEVLFVGNPGDYALLPAAVTPAGDGTLSGIATRFLGANPLDATIAADPPLMIVTTWAHVLAAQGDAQPLNVLDRYVAAGGAVLVVPDGSAIPAGRQPPDWLGTVPAPAEESHDGAELVVYDEADALWDELRDDTGGVLLRNIKAFRYHPLSPPEAADTLVGLRDGRALLCAVSHGEGRVFTSGLAFDTETSTLPLRGSFLAMVQSMALSRRSDEGRLVTSTAGEPMPDSLGTQGPARIRGLAGAPLDWRGSGRDLPALARAGVYEMTVRDGDPVYIVSRTSPREAGQQSVTSSRVPALGGMRHRVSAFRDAPSLVGRVRSARKGMDLYLVLLLLALLAVVTEGWVVNPVPRQTAKQRVAPAT